MIPCVFGMTKIAIGSDHGGYALKESLKKELKGYDVIDVGCNGEQVDYPKIASKLCDVVIRENIRGILICGTGIGMSIAANKIHGIRAALCYDEHTAKMSREHNNSNVLCLGGRVTKEEDARKILKTWLYSSFEGGRHYRRHLQIERMEGGHIKVYASMLGSDHSRLEEEITSVASCDMIHIDMMDGIFVEEKIFEVFPSLKAMPVDVHLMVQNPQPYIENALKNGAHAVTFHIESDVDVKKAADTIFSGGALCGIAVNPETRVEDVFPYLDYVDFVVVMGVHPGKCGQKFIETVPEKVKRLRKEIGSRPVGIAVDGGMNPKTAKLVIDAGADIIISSTYIFSSADRKKAIEELRRASVN